jgi:hypothetical protein
VRDFLQFSPVADNLRVKSMRFLRQICILCALCGFSSFGAPADYFAIKVVDADTGRGVPLVELATIHSVSYWTDSNGLVAFAEPGLMNEEVFFHVRGDGYEYPKDFFENRGVRLRPKAGDQAEIKIKRVNIAERLYRITGAGIYRDSLLLGRETPTRNPVLNGKVLGQDTVITAIYRGKLYWFWGDTERPSYPLGNFGASGATSDLPWSGGLSPATGINLNYFVDTTGFSKPMCPDDQFGGGLKWIEGVMTVPDESGEIRLYARVAAGTGLEKTREWHLAVFDDEKQSFRSVQRWDIGEGHDSSHPFYARVERVDYVYLYPNYRVPARGEALRSLDSYEAFTCVAGDGKFRGKETEIDRDASGVVHYSWKRGADRLHAGRMHELIASGRLKRDESWLQLRNAETGDPVDAGRGSMIASAQAGEVWLSTASSPLGPWKAATRIVSHAKYSFYNPTQHPYFDEDQGRIIYFEGTYTATFSGAPAKTPRYDYNQIMYRVALDDTRLNRVRTRQAEAETALDRQFAALPRVEPIQPAVAAR